MITKNKDKCEYSIDGKHNYKCTHEGWESETYECTECGDRYKLYYEDMK